MSARPPAAVGFGPSREQASDGLRLALRKEEAARALGISDESFDRYVKPHVRVVRANTIRLYPVPELERWLAENAALPVEEGR